MSERATVMNRSKKSAEAIVAVRRRAEREGELKDMSLEHAVHQKPGRPGRAGRRRGEAELEPGRDEAESARRAREGSGQGMYLNFSNRPVRTRMPGGVGGVGQRC